MVNAFDPATADALDERSRALVERRHELLGPAYRLFYERPVEVVRGEGVHLYGPNGERYLDAYNNVPSVGHCNPTVVQAVTEQLQLLNANTRYLTEPVLDYAERLLATHSDPLDRVMFTCSGSEANDLALRIARHHTEADGVVVTSNAYHGVTASVAEISPSLGRNVALGEHVRAVAPPGPATSATGDPGPAFATRVTTAIDDLARHGISTAAVIMDTLFSSDGMVPGPAGFLGPVVDACRAAGALFIADEVQAGFGRTGNGLWGYSRHGITPDLVTMGKPMGNGMPIAGLATRRELLDDFGSRSRYFNTFGGNSVCIAAAGAVLDVIERDGLIDNAREVGGHLARGLQTVLAADPRFRDVRHAGLYVAADAHNLETDEPNPQLAGAVVNGLRDRRVLISAAGAVGSALKIRPPLPFSNNDAEHLLESLADVLTGLVAT